ncbi:competence/damage-inducible protein A [Syntrophotalea acetylenica]|uniref:competence/damage-inducible protein A n=1 Tax=Syntrophotalea acetylenica TaxID=29542 RepID=UPI00387E1392
MNIAVLTTGDELVNGEMSDTNTARIAQLLGAWGYAVRESRAVGDDEAEIEAALHDMTARREVIIGTGGLGPTDDDLTARVAARTFGRRLVLNEEALAQIRRFFEQKNREMHPRNEKQALLPQKSVILPNRLGTAPGFYLRHGNCDLFFLPGVPREMITMLEEQVLPRLQERSGGSTPLQERILKVFGLSEPKIEELFVQAPLAQGVQLAYGVDFPFVHVKLRASGSEAGEQLDRAELHARKLLEPFVFAVGKETLAANVARMLTDANLTLALAESCTGGLVSQMLTDIPGASRFLERGAVTYSNSAKRDWLQVPDEILRQDGAVSRACARAMALGIRQSAGTDLGLAVTGIAGPDGGTPEKPVGTVFLALSAADQERVQGYRFSGDREQIRRISACMALEWLRRYLAGES